MFFTNNFDVPAKTVADIYKQCWGVELFFKWIKQHLRIKSFYGTSMNAVKSNFPGYFELNDKFAQGTFGYVEKPEELGVRVPLVPFTNIACAATAARCIWSFTPKSREILPEDATRYTSTARAFASCQTLSSLKLW